MARETTMGSELRGPQSRTRSVPLDKVEATARPAELTKGPLANLTPELIAVALRGDGRVLRELIKALTPVVQARVARVLLRTAGVRTRGVSIQQEVEDLTQDVFERLFESGGQLLRTWEPGRGMSLGGFVGLIAERNTISTLRSRPKNPLTEAPTESFALESLAERVVAHDKEIATRQVTERLVARLKNALTPLGFSVFRALFCDDKSTETVSQEFGITPEAVYAWRHRIKKMALDLALDLSGDAEARSELS
jgi:DNA-directed RNA polymerase specialized sigma24 family protein